MSDEQISRLWQLAEGFPLLEELLRLKHTSELPYSVVENYGSHVLLISEAPKRSVGSIDLHDDEKAFEFVKLLQAEIKLYGHAYLTAIARPVGTNQTS